MFCTPFPNPCWIGLKKGPFFELPELQIFPIPVFMWCVCLFVEIWRLERWSRLIGKQDCEGFPVWIPNTNMTKVGGVQLGREFWLNKMFCILWCWSTAESWIPVLLDVICSQQFKLDFCNCVDKNCFYTLKSGFKWLIYSQNSNIIRSHSIFRRLDYQLD